MWFIEDKPDTVIIQVGTNNITKKKQSQEEIAYESLEITMSPEKWGMFLFLVSYADQFTNKRVTK